jgi:DNA-binding transcriptional regulator PaaX
MHDPDRPHTTRAQAPSDALILAAVERAARHHPNGARAIPAWTILEHLGIRARTPGARHVRARLQALCDAGSLEPARRHGVATWELTSAGLRRLRRARRGGEDVLLPDAPQHQVWRVARATAEQEIERFHADVRTRLAHAGELLDADEPPPSDAWFELAEQLRWACRRLASASYCLREWREPDDDRADVDDRLDADDERLPPQERARRRARRAGRRNLRLWDQRP